AAEERELGILARRGLLRELERIALEVGELDDLIALVMMPEDRQAAPELLPEREDPRVTLGRRHLEVLRRDLFLPLRGHAVGAQPVIGPDALFRRARGHLELRVVEPH